MEKFSYISTDPTSFAATPAPLHRFPWLHSLHLTQSVACLCLSCSYVVRRCSCPGKHADLLRSLLAASVSWLGKVDRPGGHAVGVFTWETTAHYLQSTNSQLFVAQKQSQFWDRQIKLIVFNGVIFLILATQQLNIFHLWSKYFFTV